MDVYLYIKTDPGLATTVMNGLAESGAVSRAAVVTGTFDVFARIDNIKWDDLADRLVGRVHRMPGVVSTETVAAISPDAVAVKINPLPLPLRTVTDKKVALVFASIEAGSAAETLPSLARVNGVVGMALVTGAHDVILQVVGRSIDEIAGKVLREIHQIAGVKNTATALVLRLTPLAGRTARRKK